MKTNLSEFKPFSMNKNAKKEYQLATPKERAEALAISNQSDRAIDEKERRDLTQMSRQTWYRRSKLNQVPKAIADDNRNRWLLSEILVYMYRKAGVFDQPT
jgi:predicted DNA-binding transcriptional regulator AlpA